MQSILAVFETLLAYGQIEIKCAKLLDSYFFAYIRTSVAVEQIKQLIIMNG